jgi:hypothetical protein
VFEAIQTRLAPAKLCPALRYLNWESPLDFSHCIMLMNHTVRVFNVHLPPLSSHALRSFFSNIATSMPQLHTIQITLDPRQSHHSKAFADLLSRLPNLSAFILINARASSEMMRQLSLSPCLQQLETHYDHTQTADHVFPRSLGPTAFPSLKHLALTVKPKNMMNFLTNSFNPHLLTTLHVSLSPILGTMPFPTNETSKTSVLIRVVASRCPSLQTLKLDLLSHFSPYINEPPLAHCITFATLKPLTACTALVQLSVSHEYRLLISLGELKSLLQSWPLMESLSLNPHPTHLTPPSFGVGILNEFSTLCPNIQHLGLYMDATMVPIHHLPPIPSVKPILSLLTLDVGVSNIHVDGWDITTSAFLAHVCPNIKALQTEAPWRGQLKRKRSQLIPLDLNPFDDIHIRKVEESIAIRSNHWATCFRLASRLALRSKTTN